MSFELFHRSRTANPDRSMATVRVVAGGSHLVFTAAALRFVGEASTFRLLWDGARGLVGLDPVDPSDPDAYRLHRSPSTGQINMRAFIRRTGMPIGQRFELVRRGRLFVFDVTPVSDRQPYGPTSDGRAVLDGQERRTAV